MKIVVAILMVVFLLLSPFWLVDQLTRDRRAEFFAKPTPDWHGRIELWHIAEFRTWQGSVTDFLQKRADAYSKKHRGVHIDVVGLTVEKYRDRISRGLVPDAYSFPTGLLYAEQLQQISPTLPQLQSGLRCAYSDGGACMAVPFLTSGYFLAANVQLLSKYSFQLPEDAAGADAAYLQSALQISAKVPQLCIGAILAARLGLTGEPATLEQFQKGQVMLAVVDARTLGDLLRSEKQNLLVEAIPFPGYTDEVLYLAASRSADVRKAEAFSDFVEYLLSEDQQRRLTSLGALPTAVLAEAPVYTDAHMDALFAAENSVVSPDPFAYQRHKDALAEDALAALTGDAAAVASFWERMKVVESGII